MCVITKQQSRNTYIDITKAYHNNVVRLEPLGNIAAKQVLVSAAKGWVCACKTHDFKTRDRAALKASNMILCATKHEPQTHATRNLTLLQVDPCARDH